MISLETIPCYDVPRREILMPQQDQSKRIGKSSSPSIQRVVDNAKNAQRPCPVPGVTKTGQYNKQPVKP